MNAAETTCTTETAADELCFDMFGTDSERSELETAAHAVEQARLAREFKLAQRRAAKAGTYRTWSV